HRGGDRARRQCRRRGLRLPLRHRRRHGQSAIPPLPRISRPLHHPAPDRLGLDQAGGAPHRPAHLPARAPGNPRRDQDRRRRGGARGDAAASAQQPRPLRGHRRRTTHRGKSFRHERLESFFMNKVLLTGAAGDVGTRLRKLLQGVYTLRSSDIRGPADLAAGDDFVQGDLGDYAAVEKMVAGIDGIIHLGGFSVEGPWPTILNANIVGCYNLFEAAYRAGVKRVVFASSNHAVGFYPRAKKIGVDVTVKPDSRYGVSKAFGEALGSFYAEKHGMSVTCLRIGNVNDKPIDVRRLSIWLKPEDLAQLIRIGLEHPDIKFEVFYGCSDNAAAWW